MATVTDTRRVKVEISETCAYFVDYDCQNMGKHLLVMPREDHCIFVLVCDEHLNTYLKEDGWQKADEESWELTREVQI